jgi:DNA-binding XRE family transcriptional regulator
MSGSKSASYDLRPQLGDEHYDNRRFATCPRSSNCCHNPLPAARGWGERLVRQRTSLGLTQKAAAGRLGVDRSTLARWEREERGPRGRAPGVGRAIPSWRGYAALRRAAGRVAFFSAGQLRPNSGRLPRPTCEFPEGVAAPIDTSVSDIVYRPQPQSQSATAGVR